MNKESVGVLAAILSSGALALVACGGGGPSEPTSEARLAGALPLEFVNGLDQEAKIQGLAVSVDGNPYTTDAEGRISASSLYSGCAIATHGAAQYWDRKATWAQGASVFPLWPITSEFGDNYYRTLIYERPWSPSITCLTRPNAGHYTVSASPEIESSPSIMEWIGEGLDEASRVTPLAGQPRSFSWVDSAGDLSFEVNPKDPDMVGNVGLNHLRMNGTTITGGRIVFDSLAHAATNIAIHEIGHFLGLCHSLDRRDLMNVTGRDYRTQCVFGRGEENALRMIYQRRPGTRYPDSDPGAGQAARPPSTITVACPH